MKVKICGITNLADAQAAIDAGADLLGFNFAQEAKAKNRYIDPDAARDIIKQLPETIETVAVTVNDTIENLNTYLQFTDYVQLHGEEPPELAANFPGRAIKAFRVGPDFNPATAIAYPVQTILLDAYVPGARGGTGETCDWDTAQKVAALGKPLILAGGLTPDNIAEAVRAVQPYAVDVAGGVESEPGKKDHERLKQFIHRAKA